ncbi:MAG TPA: LuxR C-terminal-related transcriptional regulator [Chloroflexaceae bacterium]|nr:LuxR C-terminal-related transcriptional regulator [Chloroflexaceae bacterium]
MTDRTLARGVALDTMLQSKLHLPGVPPGHVARPRLLAQLAGARQARLTLITAPAGAGKTTLASSWARQQSDAVAWLELDAADNDPGRFWPYVLHAVGGAEPATVAPLLAALRGPQPPPVEATLAALLNGLAARPAPLALVLDDYHVIEAPAIHRALGWLIDHLPPNVHLLIVSRADPPLPLGRWRARGQLCELRVHDLRFTLEEAAAFLTGTMGLPLGAAEVAQLDARVEGWAAGLQLAALALRGRDDPGARIAAFSGRHEYVLAFLADEVLAGQPEYVQTFLLHTAILDRLSAPLCDAVLEAPAPPARAAAIPTSRFILDYLRESNLFLVPLDDDGGWYRYHHLFRDMLRHRLRQVSPALAPELHRRAARWHAEQGMTDAAVRHALAAGDHQLAARWIERAVDATLRDGDLAPLRGWLAALPEALIRARPRLAIGHIWLLFIMGQDELTPPWLDALTAALEQEPDGDAVRSAAERARLRAELAALRAERALHAGALAEVAAQCRAGLAEAPAEALRTRGTLALLQGTAARVAGDLEAAEGYFMTARDLAERGGEQLLLLYVANNLADLAEVRGSLGAMAREHERMRRLSADAAGQPLPLAGMALVGMGKVARERNDLDAAEALIAEGVALGRRSAISGIAIDGLITLALARRARGDLDGARAHLDEAAELAERWHPAQVGARVAAFQARLALAAGRVKEAARWALGAAARADEPYSDLGEIERLTLARVWVAQGRADAALALLARLEGDAERAGRRGRLVEILALRGLALAAAGDADAALAAVAQALARGQAEGYVRVFADEGRAMGRLVARVAARPGGWPELGLRQDYLDAVRAAWGAVGAEGDAPAGDGPGGEDALVEPLSAREREVLGLVAAGCSNQEIAERLIISVATVRKHVENIHGKLGVQSRTQAAARARELGLV